MEIKAKCFTNLDDYSCNVNRFQTVPNIGDYVDTIYKGHKVRLKVVSILHTLDHNDQPIIRIELNK